MKKIKFPHITISILLPIGLLFFLFTQWQALNDSIDNQWNSGKKTNTHDIEKLNRVDTKQKGAHVFGMLDSTNFQFLTRNNIEWVTLVAWGVQDDFDSPIMNHHNGDSFHIQQSDSSWLSQIEIVRSAGFKIFVKPHIWVNYPSNGKWRSDIYPSNEENWELWKNSYRDFIFRYAHLAEKANAEMFCIGTELSRLSVEKPVFWKVLIQEVRSIYSGKITYAANWHNEFEKIFFWDDLDYIGIQAYFPLVKNKNPSVKQISKGWTKYFPSLASIHKKFKRKILFTEIGYKSTADSAISPWEWVDPPLDQGKAFSTATQANCYQAFFNSVWEKEWMAGIHIWQLRSDFEEEDPGKNNLDFTPQGKSAENIIAKGFE